MPTAIATLIDDICELARQRARGIHFITEPITRGRAITWLEQHWLRNRELSAVLRPAWMSRCDDPAVVEKTIAQMRQELVYDDEVGQGHRAILAEFAAAMGLSKDHLDAVQPLVSTRACFHILENMARTQWWIHGWVATSLGEYLLLESEALDGSRWQQAFGLSDQQVFFLTYHKKADQDHAGSHVWQPMLKYVHTEEQARQVLTATELTLYALRLFYDGIVEFGDRRTDAPAQ